MPPANGARSGNQAILPGVVPRHAPSGLMVSFLLHGGVMTDTVHIEIRDGAKHLGEFSFRVGDRPTAGRSDECDIVLDARDVSRNHCSIHLEEQYFTIDDHSLNGVTIPENTGSGQLAYGSLCGIGSLQLYVHRATPHASPSADIHSIRKQVLSRLTEELRIPEVKENAPELVFHVESILDRLLHDRGIDESRRSDLVRILRDEALGLGPLEPLLRDDTISEIMVVAPALIFVEKQGVLQQTDLIFTSETSVRTVIDRIVAPLGRRVDEASPMVDARLPDGSRVNAVIPPLSLKGAAITIRKFSDTPLSMDDLISFGSMTEDMAALLKEAVLTKQNIIISGGTGSGKTTLLNVLSSHIPGRERIITIEDAAELQLLQPHVVSLESRPKNSEGLGEVTIRDLVKNALRMRPDRIIVGECRGSETLDMLQAMNTGHDGSLSTTHANSPVEAISRLETLTLMAGLDLPTRAIREQIAGAIHLVVQQSRFADGKRRITAITEIGGIDKSGRIETFDLWRYVPGTGESSASSGMFQATGRIPRFQLAKG
jgi:pilus assembly protein CpaF